jgi:hypothetical protein
MTCLCNPLQLQTCLQSLPIYCLNLNLPGLLTRLASVHMYPCARCAVLRKNGLVSSFRKYLSNLHEPHTCSGTSAGLQSFVRNISVSAPTKHPRDCQPPNNICSTACKADTHNISSRMSTEHGFDHGSDSRHMTHMQATTGKQLDGLSPCKKRRHSWNQVGQQSTARLHTLAGCLWCSRQSFVNTLQLLSA